MIDVSIFTNKFINKNVPGQFPYQAALLNSQGRLFCGGAIIDKSHVLTAAHCCDLYRPGVRHLKSKLNAQFD